MRMKHAPASLSIPDILIRIMLMTTTSSLIFSCESLELDGQMEGIDDPCSCNNDIIVHNNDCILGYTTANSYSSGETIPLRISSKFPTYEMQLCDMTSSDLPVIMEWSNSRGFLQDYDECCYQNGCDWEVTDSLEIPEGLRSGYYSILVKNECGTFQVPFVLRPSELSRILCVASTNTWHAYNSFGGGSFYKLDNQDPKCSRNYSQRISLSRPLSNLQGSPNYQGHLFHAELGLIHWLDSLNYRFDVITDGDLARAPSILLDYDLVLLNTHSEYWTESALTGMDIFLNEGGSLAYIGANGMYWKVTSSEGVIECQKEGGSHLSDGTPGGKWRDLGRPESRVLGVQYTPAGYQTFMPYVVIQGDHWLLEGSELKTGDLFGISLNRNYASGHETDKVNEDSPLNLEIIARGLNQERIDELGKRGSNRIGGGDMVFYRTKYGGSVFSTGSITSSGSMLVDSTMSTILRNYIKYALDGVSGVSHE